MGKGSSERQASITGIVTATDWDEDGNVIAVALSTPHEEEYLIKKDPVGEELFDLFGAEVLVTGIVDEDKCGNKTITVKRYKLLEEEDEDEEEEEDEEELEDLEEYEEDDEKWEE